MLLLVINLLWHRLYKVKAVQQQLAQLEASADGELNAAERKKIISRQVIFIPVIADAFNRLRNRSTNTAEQERLMQFFVNSSLFDDFFDEQLLTNDQIAAISFSDDYTPQTYREKLFLQLKKNLDGFASGKAGYVESKQAVFQSQLASSQQLAANTSTTELLNISLAKGGYSVQLCSYYMADAITTTEQQCWYQLGAIIQLSNDIFDIYKDVQQGIYTYPNRCSNMAELHQTFTQEVQVLHQSLQQLPHSKLAKMQLTIAMSGIVALGFTAIQQLQALQGKKSTINNWQHFQRSQLICDMEKIPNMLRWFGYCYRWGK